jgi:pimeloyl-ACP methyl ester carboxylesterase
MKDEFIPNGEVMLHRIRRGSKDAPLKIVIVPGMIEAGEDRLNIIINNFTTLYLSIRGRGQSTSPTHGYSFMDQVQDVLCMVEDVNKCVLIGISTGAAFAIKAAAVRPNKVVGLVIVDFSPAYPKYSEKWKDNILRLSNRKISNTAINGIIKDAERVELDQELTTLQFPVLILKGKKDGSLLSETALSHYLDYLPHSEIRLIQSAGHMIFDEDPTAIKEVKSFIENLI